MTTRTADPDHALPKHIAVIGAAGGLGQAILRICREEGVGFTAIVRSRPERIVEVPEGSRVVVVKSLGDGPGLTDAFAGSEVVISAMGVTASSSDRAALLSANMDTVERSMLAAGVDRIILINTLLSSSPGQSPSWTMRFFSLMPGKIGRGAREQNAVVEALGRGAFSALRWTLVRAGVNSRGKDEPPVAAAAWSGAANSWMPVSYAAMGRWMLEESVANKFIHGSPLVSKAR
jgi:putative NADH-flavin reductase